MAGDGVNGTGTGYWQTPYTLGTATKFVTASGHVGCYARVVSATDNNNLCMGTITSDRAHIQVGNAAGAANYIVNATSNLVDAGAAGAGYHAADRTALGTTATNSYKNGVSLQTAANGSNNNGTLSSNILTVLRGGSNYGSAQVSEMDFGEQLTAQQEADLSTIVTNYLHSIGAV